MAWCLVGFFALVLLIRSWDLRACRSVEAPSDAVCRRSEGRAAWMCLLETTAECEFLLLALHSYAAAAALSYFAAALGLAGLTLERRRLEERWPCLRGEASEDASAHEREALLRKA
mmetsp:Transcript_91932/g.297387  ORF Transcript_91932/g.297387 Transcript_91932/m.297387 type:complete len:116 (-) Transcript_91932:42-389(-)